MRFGEAAALRWRHYEPHVGPLGRLSIEASFSVKLHAEKATKTENSRQVPVSCRRARAARRDRRRRPQRVLAILPDARKPRWHLRGRADGSTIGVTMPTSRYHSFESGRDLNYYRADPNLRALLEHHLPASTLAWADGVLASLGERCGTVIVRRADQTDRVGHTLIRYDRHGRDISEIAYHPGWLANLDEVFDFGVVGWNYDAERLARYG